MFKVVKYDDHEINIDYNRQYIQKFTSKPTGFWVTIDHDYDWKYFCENNEYGIDRLKVKNYFNLKTDNMLIINNLKEFDHFNKWYVDDNCSFNIDWDKISKQYDGILITDYFWERRLSKECKWYYGWDCASGCIWNLEVLEKIIDK